ncbi:hypothetical protein O0L34_g18279 [Tuta absoluta]|nr:hypothetical protein O0L34_g18279 [Tuta absoluta]
MRLKYSRTLLEAQDGESPIADISWSPNNVKLAVATCDRTVMLFDREGVRRDKFNTKPADPAAGKKSYVIISISFSDNSELLGVAQSDNMVFVYRVGADWSGKKVICNKFPLSGAPMRLIPAENGFSTGTSDGKIRTLDCKSNKSISLWTCGACCVSIARGPESSLASGHIDGTIYLSGRLLLRYALPPTALILLPPYLIVGACDGRVAIYEAQRGALIRNIEPQLPPDRKDLISAEPSPSGQTIAFGIFDGVLIGEVKESGNVELSTLRIPHLHAGRAVAWSGDGTKLAVASQTGALILLEAVLRRWVWRDAVEVQHVSPKQLVLSRLANDAAPLTVQTKHAPDIFNVRFIGNDWYAVCRTASTLILCDIGRGLTSEIPWSGGGERVYAAVGGACLLHRAGELSLVEYGLDKVLHTVRTERVNPHVLSVRINEGAHAHAHAHAHAGRERKHLAYLLDRQTIAVVDLITGVQLGQWWHEARVDWLELNESGQLLLLRDTRRRLLLLRLDTGDKEIIASGVGFVQWIENSDAVVAQTPTHLLIWYSAWDPGSVEMAECGGGSAVEVSARRVLFEGGQLPYLQLDEHRLAFSKSSSSSSARYSAWDPGSVEMAECGGGSAVEVSARRVLFEGGQLPYLQLDEHRLAFSKSSSSSSARYSAWDPGCVEMAECGGGSAVEVSARRVLFEGGQLPYLQLDEHRLAFSKSSSSSSARYSAWDPGSVEMAECGGGSAVEVSARRVLFEGGQLPYLQLDEHRLAFSKSLSSSSSARYSAWDPGSVEMAECGGGSAVEVSARRVLFEGGQLPYLQLDEHRLAFSKSSSSSSSSARYSAWDPGSVEMAECGGGSAVEVSARRVLFEGGQLPYLQLDEHRLAFSKSSSSSSSSSARYSAWDPGSVEMAECGGGSAVEVSARRVLFEGGQLPYLQLDEHRLAFSKSSSSSSSSSARYSAWDPGSVEMAECGGGSAVEVSARRVLFEGGQLPYLQLDEHLLAFNNALRMGDLAGCGKYLDGVGHSADLAPLWRQLAERALTNDDIQLAAKCYRSIGDEARTFYLDKTVELAATEGGGDVTAGLNSPILRARLAIFAGDLATAEECYVKRANRPDLAINMYKQFNKWTEAIALAEKTDRASVMALKQQHMDYLTSTGRLGEAGAALASTGDVQGAVRLWLKGGRARRAASLLLQHPQMLRDNELVDAVHTQLIQEEWWEMAGELSERKGETMAAVEYYARGNNYARAVQLAREACPSEVTRLEGMWGNWLVSSRQAGAAVPHLIEAGETRAALAAAIKAHHYKRALQIVQVIEDKESIREECEQLGDHFISIQEWETAERVLSSCGMAERCVRSYNAAGRVADGLRLAAAQLTEEETRDIYIPLAQQLRQEGQLRKAEQIYIGLGEADEAISMYKEATQYEAMLRLVAAHRSSLLEATRRHVAQALHASGDLRAAENYYVQAGDWKSAIQMYRFVGQWEGAERVARAHAPSSVQQQVALQWAGALGGAPAARLLAARGLAALGAKWALQAQRWDIAMELSELGGGITKREVTRHEAAALAEEHPEEAEAAFIRAGAFEDAVRMWMTRGHHQRALQLAEQHADHMVEEVLVEGARAAAERGDLNQFETLMIRANRPREVVQHYKELELWEEAARVSREYLPDSAEPVPPTVPPLLQRAADHADRGEWWEAVELLIKASAAGASGGATRLAERAALRAARLARDHLQGAGRTKAADMLADRFTAIGQSEVGEQLRAALSEGYGGEDDTIGASTEYAEEESAPAPHVSETEMEAESEGLERLARAGHWQRCLAHAGAKAPHYALRYSAHLFKAHQRVWGCSAGHWQRCLAHAGAKAPHYALRYSAHLFKAHQRMEGVDLDSEEVPEALSQVLDTLRQYLVNDSGSGLASSDAPLARAVSSEILVRISMAPKAFSAMKDAAAVLLAAAADDRAMQAITLLMALHVPQIALKAARSLPRYTDITVADVVYYACGMAVRAEGSNSFREAFVLLNRSLDLAEAADDDSAHLLDYTDFECTDWSRAPLLLEQACVRGAALDDVREWVLSVSMDQSVEQTLPVDSRGLYSSSAGADEPCCVLTGYPLGSRLVTFTNGRCANREWWSRCVHAGRGGGGGGGGGVGGGGAVAALLAHIGQWCGPADYSHI